MAKKKKQLISDEVLCAEYEAVYRYILSLCRERTEAEDVTQETFLKALNGIDHFKGESSLYTWLCRMAKNTWIDRCRKANREVQFADLSGLEGVKNPAVGHGMIQERDDVAYCGGFGTESGMLIEDQLSEKETAFYIHKILHELKEPYKEVFSLRVFGQLSFGEIGKLFDKSESWARVTYHRGRKAIFEKMRKDGQNG